MNYCCLACYIIYLWTEYELRVAFMQIISSQNICFRKKDIYFQTGSKQELNYTYKICIMITLLTAFYSYLCIVKSFK